MFEVTAQATEKIREAFGDRDPLPSIRIVYNGGG